MRLSIGKSWVNWCDRLGARSIQRWSSTTAASAERMAATIDEDGNSGIGTSHLLEFRRVRLGYPSSQTWTKHFDLAISHPTSGGHALLGYNNSGKSLIGQAIVAHRGDSSSSAHTSSEDYVKEGGPILTGTQWMSNAVAHVSFDSHKQLLQEGSVSSVTTYRAISQGGNLNKAAQFLIVRFGLYGLLERTVDTLSTGEIRKVMLVRALSTRPKLLILDNAFDGLDVASRQVLKDLVEKTISGFKQDILVQGVSSSATAHTQVLIMTHRPEELVDEVKTISWFDKSGNLITEGRQDRTGSEVMEASLGVSSGFLSVIDWEDPTIPSVAEINEAWGAKMATSPTDEPLVQTSNLSIQRGNTTLLHDLSWSILPGQRWLVGGGNGAGKSTLSRLLARPENSSGLAIRGKVSWVSTERHMEVANSTELVQTVLQSDGAALDSAKVIADWLGVGDTLERTFSHLSQGQQKLVLIASAIASKPDLLVLDEPCQGLDGVNRQRVLALVERLCQATNIGLIYITHHLEELLPSVTHVLHLKECRDVYNGSIATYDPESL